MRTTTPAQPLPIYLQISELLARQIKAGYWQTNERLPTEAELAQSLSVAVGTLRKALALLEQQGVLERIQGSGTYVRNAESSQQRIYELFRLELHHGPGLPTAHILDVCQCSPPSCVPALSSTPNNAAWRVRRLRFLNQVPIALEEIWFDAQHCNHLEPSELGDSMYLFYQQRFNLWIARVEDHISAAVAPDWTQPPIGMQAGSCAGYIERTAWTATNTLAEYSQTWFDPAVCRYSARMRQ